jgi:hypothetical protein
MCISGVGVRDQPLFLCINVYHLQNNFRVSFIRKVCFRFQNELVLSLEKKKMFPLRAENCTKVRLSPDSSGYPAEARVCRLCGGV